MMYILLATQLYHYGLFLLLTDEYKAWIDYYYYQ